MSTVIEWKIGERERDLFFCSRSLFISLLLSLLWLFGRFLTGAARLAWHVSLALSLVKWNTGVFFMALLDLDGFIAGSRESELRKNGRCFNWSLIKTFPWLEFFQHFSTIKKSKDDT